MARVTMRDKAYVAGLDDDETYALIRALTLPNPAYVSAMKYSGYSRVTLPETLTYYETFGPGKMIVPIGIDVSEYANIEGVKDERVSEVVEYPPFKLELREDQAIAVNKYIKQNKKGKPPQGIITLPTGKGKTIVGLCIAAKLKQKTLIIVHKDDLVLGWMNDIALCFGSEFKPGLIKAKSRTVGDQVTVATIQTLNRVSERQLDELLMTFGLVICDEGHHISSSTYTMFGCFNSMYKLLLTATPERADGLTDIMFYYAGGFAYRYQNAGDKEKDILPVLVLIRESGLRFSPGFDSSENMVNIHDLPEGADDPDLVCCLEEMPYEERPRLDYHKVDDYVVTNIEYIRKVVSDIRREAKRGYSCLVFLTQKEHCRIYANYLTQVLGDTVQLFYGDSEASNAEILEKAESKEKLVTIATFSKATEGTNCKAWEVCFLVSSINNGKNVEQAIGRIRRTREGKLNPVRVYDYRHPEVYMMRSHGATRDARYEKLGFKVYVEPVKKQQAEEEQVEQQEKP
ncbi:MAG: DEAD/DEAH box helicase family protein [Clostridiales bacterium]|jgi:superfamily II DNA or RNA helicase|nr:DEAD/DEAH box helicase family protein [Clostridiales bacterium]